VIDAKRVRPALLDSIRAPLVVDFHDDYWIRFLPYPSPDLPLRWLRQRQLRRHHLEVIKRARAVVAHSESVADSLRPLLGSDEKLFMAPYGINAQSFEFKTRESDRGQEKSPVILFVGRDVFRKGFPVMAGAMPRVLESHPQAKLVVMGNEYVHTRATARFLSRGLPVKFLPGQPRAALNEWYHRAGLLVLPSYQEAFGIVLIKAMASGLPVVAARTGGIPEAVEHNVSGLLHRPGDAADLAEKITSVLDDAGLQDRLVEGGRERVKKFSFENMGKSLERAYFSVVKDR